MLSHPHTYSMRRWRSNADRSAFIMGTLEAVYFRSIVTRANTIAPRLWERNTFVSWTKATARPTCIRAS